MTARQKNWMTFGIVWGIILTVCGVLAFIGYRFIDRTFYHTKPELYDETKFQYALYAASNKENDSLEEYVYGDQCTFTFSRYAHKPEDYYDDNGEIFSYLLSLEPREEWHNKTDSDDKNFKESFIYSIFDDGFEFLGITLNDSFDRLRIERHSWDDGPLASFYDTYYRFYRIDKNKGEKLFDIAKSLAI